MISRLERAISGVWMRRRCRPSTPARVARSAMDWNAAMYSGRQRGDLPGPAVGVSAVVQGGAADEATARADHFGPRQRKGREDRVARGHIGHRDPGRERGGSAILGGGDLVRERGPAEPSQVEFDDLMPAHVEGPGHTPGGRDFDLVTPAVAEREGIDV